MEFWGKLSKVASLHFRYFLTGSVYHGRDMHKVDFCDYSLHLRIDHTMVAALGYDHIVTALLIQCGIQAFIDPSKVAFPAF